MASKSGFKILDSLEQGGNALLLYDKEKTVDKYLFHYVKTGLERGDVVYYWAGVRTAEEAEQQMMDHGIDCTHHKNSGNLRFTTYDDIFLNDGRFDAFKGQKNIFNMTNGHNGTRVRIATESNWWLLADLFERGIDVETVHEMMPSTSSALCTYNIRDLMDYVNLYHLAKLMELHNETLLFTNGSTVLPPKFYSYLGKCVIDVLQESFNYITIVRKKHSRFISEILLELEMRIGSDMAELERHVEERLRQFVKLH